MSSLDLFVKVVNSGVPCAIKVHGLKGGPIIKHVVSVQSMPEGSNQGYVYGLVFHDALHGMPKWFNERGEGFAPQPITLEFLGE